jgi:SAM-dependent methyltransferase
MATPLVDSIPEAHSTTSRTGIVLRAPSAREKRSPEQLWQHYVVEKELATRLRMATQNERAHLYASAYEELFKRVPDHPQLTRKTSPEQQAGRIRYQLRLLQPWLTPQTTFLEIGAGDCALSFAVAPLVTHAYAVDVSETITRAAATPKNFTLLLSKGTNIPLPEGRITLAYSNQLMEHLHPDDALDQLADIYRSLALGGTYVCVTPNRLTGPHDISRYFDETATGFHLKEYTSRELIAMFERVGFRTAHQCVMTNRGPVSMPNSLWRTCERTFESIPRGVRVRVSRGTIAKLFELRIVAVK